MESNSFIALVTAATAFLVALAKYEWLLKKAMELALRHSLNPNNEMFNSIRMWTREGIVAGMTEILKENRHIDYFLILRLDKNGQHWISQEEFIRTKKFEKKPDLDHTPANEYKSFWEMVQTAKNGYYEVKNLSDEQQNDAALLLFKQYGIVQATFFPVHNSEIIVVACSLDWSATTPENNLKIKTALSRMDETMRFLYNYKIHY